MKKLLVTIVAVFMAVVGYAQTTFNVRIGGGAFGASYYDYYDDDYSEFKAGAAFAFESNIPLGARINKFVFSPSLFIVSDFEVYTNLNIPLHFGCKVPLGHGSLFIPKIGPMIGTHTVSDEYYEETDIEFAFGPSAEFSFEIKHFVVAANGYYDVANSRGGVFCTIGYKF
ncbi:MAG: hypothetical protein J6C86_02625 [Bacteroidaceae bacterium]|nr:hypothetical protein [Bacteroidaceae bacterium]